MARELDDDRVADIASALNGRIRTGESLLVRKGEAGIEVHVSDESPLKETHPELYGQLLSANEQVSQAGMSYFWILGCLALTACIAIHREWFDKIGTLSVDKLQSFWTYVLVVGAGFVMSIYLTEFAEARVYHRWKRTITEGLEKAGMGRYPLLALLEGHVEVKSIGDLIKRDQHFERLD